METNRINYLFPGFFCIGEVSNHNILKPLLLNKIKELNFGVAQKWYSNVLTTFEEINPNLKEFVSIFETAITPNLQYLHTSLNGSSGKKLKIMELWINKYKMGDYQETHTHSDGGKSIFSCAYFLNYNNKTDAKFVFYNPTIDANNDAFSTEYFNSSTFLPNVVEGNILFFRSNQHHFVTQQKENTNRITISANFSLMDI